MTIMGAAAAVYLVLDRLVSRLFAKLDADRSTSYAGFVVVFSLGGFLFGAALTGLGHPTAGTIALVLATALVISGIRYSA